MTREEFKIFKRLLKELGIYSAWLKNRLEHVGPHRSEYKELTNDCLSEIINRSFSWAETHEDNLWFSIYYFPLAKKYPDAILNNEEDLNNLKKFIKTINL